MAVFTTLALQNALTAEEQLLAGLPGLRHTLALSRVVAPTFRQWLSTQVAEERRGLSEGTRTFPARRSRERYGEWKDRKFTDADAIRSWGLRHYRDRLRRERADLSSDQIQQFVDEVANSDDFKRRVRGWEADLAAFRAGR
jgi:hypothetical protein